MNSDMLNLYCNLINLPPIERSEQFSKLAKSEQVLFLDFVITFNADLALELKELL